LSGLQTALIVDSVMVLLFAIYLVIGKPGVATA
jgi:hypothetical protein